MIEVDEKRAYEILDIARENLISHLVAQRDHPHLTDDCGDYLDAATETWTTLFYAGWNNDWVDFTAHVNNFLNVPSDDWLASDGEIRYDLPETKEVSK